MDARSTTIPATDSFPEKWYIIDASGHILGRLAARVATLLKGKHLPSYTPHLDPKVHVIVTNADKVLVTGDKLIEKTYKWHTRYRTGVKEESLRHLLDRKPEEVIRRAVHGMLPKNRLGRTMDKHLRVYASGQYDNQHVAQKPEALELRTRTAKTR